MILVTGNQGFIGKHLTKELDLLGLDWKGYDLLSNNNDIRDLARLDRAFDMYQPDIVIHMAALSGARRGDAYPQEYFDTNVIGSENVARMCEKYGVKKLIAFSSSSAKSCVNTYGITKRAMELMLMNKNILHLYIVRPFNVYGENGRPDQVIEKWNRLAKAGRPIIYHGDLIKRNYSYVGDFVKHIISLVLSQRYGKFILDIGSKEQVRLIKLLNVFKEKYPNLQVQNSPITDTDVTPDDDWDFPTDFLTKVKELIA